MEWGRVLVGLAGHLCGCRCVPVYTCDHLEAFMYVHTFLPPHTPVPLRVTVPTVSLEVWAPLHRLACVYDTLPVYTAYSLPREE